jgi:hypothetical protein
MGSTTVPLTSCLTGLESAARLLKIFVFIGKTYESKPVKQEVNSTVLLPPLELPAKAIWAKPRPSFAFRTWACACMPCHAINSSQKTAQLQNFTNTHTHTHIAPNALKTSRGQTL